MDPLKALKVKTGSCRRLLKELHMYREEVEREQKKTERMIAQNADPHDLKQQENVLGESRMMVPDSRKRLEAAAMDLQSVVDSADEKLRSMPDFKAAQETLEQVQSVSTA